LNLDKYRSLFVEEATEHLGEMSRALVALEKRESTEESLEAVDTLFRMAHSIKGMAASLDYASVSTLAHRLEDWLEPLRRSADFPPAAFDVLYEVLRALESMVSEIAGTGRAPAPRDDLVEALARPPAEWRPAGETAASAPARRRVPAPAAPAPAASVRVRAEAVDRFLATVGELMQRRARLAKLHRQVPFWLDHPEFREELERMEDAVVELRRRALDIRTTPVRRLLERLPRVASELARLLGKRVRVELRGEEVEVDRAVLDHLDDPLLHLVRNAVDHGLEPPDARERAGKDPVGTVRVSAWRTGSRVRVRLEEDGRGIDADALRRKAVERGLLAAEVAEDLPLARVCELCFEPGISTASEVTAVSGRGVGLDAVKRTVEALGGSVSVETRPGAGTSFELDLPSMVALQRVLLVELQGERVALVVSAVQSVVDIAEGAIEQLGPDAFFTLHGEPLPLVDLGARIGLPAAAQGGRGNVVIVDARGFRVGLRVDRALEELEVFVREVPAALGRLPAIGGVAILPDGVPVFLVEVAELVEAA
jgi:two-component system chemotaxis sensor kinase CheA